MKYFMTEFMLPIFIITGMVMGIIALSSLTILLVIEVKEELTK